jgi:hypothetical protein
MFRVNYTAKNFGFVGWEVFREEEHKVMMDCITIARSQMQKQIGEKIEYRVITI